MSTPPGSESLISSLDHRKSFSVKEVSEFTGLGIRAIQKYAHEGVIPGALQPRPGKRAVGRSKLAGAYLPKIQKSQIQIHGRRLHDAEQGEERQSNAEAPPCYTGPVIRQELQNHGSPISPD